MRTLSAERAQRPPTQATGLTLPPRTVALSVAACLLLLSPGVLSFGPVFDGADGYLAAGGGALLGVGIAVVARWRRWALASVAAVTVFTYLLFGGFLALRRTTIGGVVPTVDTLLRLVPLSVQAWRDLLTVSPPANSFVGPAVVPYLSGLVLGLVAGWVVLHPRRYLWTLAPTLGLLVVGILWGLRDAPLAAALGVGFGAVALGWASWRRSDEVRRASDEILGASPATNGRRRLGGAAAMLAAGVVAALAASPALGAGVDRQVLRDLVEPPLDLRAYASPLTGYRYLEVEAKKVHLFTVRGLPDGARVRLATLDKYDGNDYNVAENSAGFLRMGERRAAPTAVVGAPATLEIAVEDYAGYWLPGGGDVREVRFTGPRAERQADGLHYNAYGGTLLTTAGLTAGDAYVVNLVWAAQPAVEDAQLTVADAPAPRNENVPDSIGKVAADLAGDAATPGEQLRRIEQGLRDLGYYSNGSDGKSRAGHTAERLATMLTAPLVVGDDEQYAVAMALMARELGIPARVVMGFYPQESEADPLQLDVTGAMAHVWVEVAFEDVGWVAYDPTPDRNKAPQSELPKPKPTTRPQVLTPPDVPPNTDADPLDLAGEKPAAEEDPGLALLLRILGVLGTVLAIGAVVAGPFVAISALKKRRTARRRHAPDVAARFSGGWAELVDVATDLGTRVPAAPTRRESALMLADAHPASEPLRIAAQADAGVFGAATPSPDAAALLWDDVDSARAAMFGQVGRWRRLHATFSLRSLLSGHSRPSPRRLDPRDALRRLAHKEH